MRHQRYSSARRLALMAQENRHNVLEIQLSGDNDIGAQGRTFIKVTSFGDDWIKGRLMEFHQSRGSQKIPENVMYEQQGGGNTYWCIGKKFHLNASDIATATPNNMLSQAEIFDGDRDE